MSRLIDADNFKNRMYHEAFEKDSDMQKWDSGCWIRYKMFENVLREQPTITPEPHWTPVTERLPKESGCYLVSVKNDHERRYFKTAWFEKDTWFARQNVIAWMPLPEPYKEVTE